ncbi:MAG: ATPase [Sphingomonadales bacterium]|nr:ATPase [Sphingomonadales bacterium]
MPQIAQLLETYASQIFWMLVTFGIIYFGIARMMLPKVEATVDQRNKKIADDLATAEAARAEAEQLEEGGDKELVAARTEAQAKANAAKAKAAAATEKSLAAADAEIAEKMATAEADLAKATASAMASVESVASEAAADIVAKVSGVSITPAAAAKAVKAVMANG